MEQELNLSVSEFVALFNQTLEFAYPSVTIVGELSNFRVSKNRWVYFDLKDDTSSLKCFATVYSLPGPLEDGMLLKVIGQPKLHNLYGFSINVSSMQPAGEGSLLKAANLLEVKLRKEGLFDEARKRHLPYPPLNIGLITSDQSAAYADFNKIINARWRGLSTQLINVQVQGEPAPLQIANAIDYFNAEAEPPEVLVIIRGGGSSDDLAAFNDERVVRAVAGSRAPTIVAIGHEVDISLSELAADVRASTPSNAAELLVPDIKNVMSDLDHFNKQIDGVVHHHLVQSRSDIKHDNKHLTDLISNIFKDVERSLKANKQLVAAFNPEAILKRGYAIVRDDLGKIVYDSKQIKLKDKLNVKLASGKIDVIVESKED